MIPANPSWSSELTPEGVFARNAPYRLLKCRRARLQAVVVRNGGHLGRASRGSDRWCVSWVYFRVGAKDLPGRVGSLYIRGCYFIANNAYHNLPVGVSAGRRQVQRTACMRSLPSLLADAAGPWSGNTSNALDWPCELVQWLYEGSVS